MNSAEPRQEDHLRVALGKERRSRHQARDDGAHRDAEGQRRKSAQREPLEHHVDQDDEGPDAKPTDEAVTR